MSQVGAGYRYATAIPGVAFDCSGLTSWAWGRAGVGLPRNSRAQFAATPRVPIEQIQPGDLVFWGPGGSEHVALYMGGNQIVHAFSSAGRTQVTALAGWWKPPSGYGRLNY